MMSTPFLVGPLLSFMTDTVVLLTSVNEYVVTMANCMNHMLVICIVVTLASFYRKNMYLNFPIYSIFSCLQLFWVPKIDDRKTNTVHLLLSVYVVIRHHLSSAYLNIELRNVHAVRYRYWLLAMCLFQFQYARSDFEYFSNTFSQISLYSPHTYTTPLIHFNLIQACLIAWRQPN